MAPAGLTGDREGIGVSSWAEGGEVKKAGENQNRKSSQTLSSIHTLTEHLLCTMCQDCSEFWGLCVNSTQ